MTTPVEGSPEQNPLPAPPYQQPQYQQPQYQQPQYQQYQQPQYGMGNVVPPQYAPTGYAPALPALTLASPWSRLGALLLNGVLIVVTLGIGYLIWTMVLWSEGTNPGKKILGMKTVNATTGQTCTWGEMFVRNFLFGGLVLGLLNAVTFTISSLVDALFIFGDKNQRLIDKWAKTLVVNS